MVKTTEKKIAFIILCFTLFISCDVSYFNKEIEDIKWSGGIQIPIGEINYTVSDLIEEAEIDGIVTKDDSIIYSQNEKLFWENQGDLSVNIQDIDTTGTITHPDFIANILNSSNSNIFVLPDDYEYSINDSIVYFFDEIEQNLHNGFFDAGKLDIIITSDFDPNIDINYSIDIPSLKKDGESYTMHGNLSQTNHLISIDLKEYEIDFTHNGNDYTTDTFNTLVVKISVGLKYHEGDTFTANSSDYIDYRVKLSQPEIRVVFGDFKKDYFEINDQSITLEAFNDVKYGNISFANPTINLTTNSSYGFDMGIKTSAIKAIKGSDTIALEYTNETITIKGVKVEEYNENILSKETVITLNKDNSNLKELLEINPSKIIFNDTEIIINPEGNGPNSNFYTPSNDDLDLEVDLDIEIPLEIATENIEFEETFELESIENIEEITNINLFLKTENSTPLSGKLSLMFLETDIEKEVLFNGAEVDENGRSIGFTTTNNNVTFSFEEIENIKSGADIKISVSLNTPANKEFVKLLGSNRIKIYISTKVEGEFTPSE